MQARPLNQDYQEQAGYLQLKLKDRYLAHKSVPLPFSRPQLIVMHRWLDCFLEFYGQGSEELMLKHWRAQGTFEASSKKWTPFFLESNPQTLLNVINIALNLTHLSPKMISTALDSYLLQTNGDGTDALFNQKYATPFYQNVMLWAQFGFERKDGRIVPKPMSTKKSQYYVDSTQKNTTISVPFPEFLLPDPRKSSEHPNEDMDFIWNNALISSFPTFKRIEKNTLYWDNYQPKLMEQWNRTLCIQPQLKNLQSFASFLKISSQPTPTIKPFEELCVFLKEAIHQFQFITQQEYHRAVLPSAAYALWNHQHSGYLHIDKKQWADASNAHYFPTLLRAQEYRTAHRLDSDCSIVQFQLIPKAFVDAPKGTSFATLCHQFQSQLDTMALEKVTAKPSEDTKNYKPRSL